MNADSGRKKGKMKKKVFIISIVIAIIVLAVWATYPQRPDVEIKSIESLGVGGNKRQPTIVLEFNLLVDNPNLIGGTINGVEGKLFLGSNPQNIKYVGDFSVPGFEIAGGESLEVPCSFEMKNIPGEIVNIPNEEKRYVLIQGSADISLILTGVSIPFEKGKYVSINDL